MAQQTEVEKLDRIIENLDKIESKLQEIMTLLGVDNKAKEPLRKVDDPSYIY